MSPNPHFPDLLGAQWVSKKCEAPLQTSVHVFLPLITPPPPNWKRKYSLSFHDRN